MRDASNRLEELTLRVAELTYALRLAEGVAQRVIRMTGFDESLVSDWRPVVRNALESALRSTFSHKDSPCVARCSTALGDDVCRGCGRTAEEVANWVTYTDAQKAAIMERLHAAKV